MPVAFPVRRFVTPVGVIEISASPSGIRSVLFSELPALAGDSHPLLDHCERQLQEYFDGGRRHFQELPLEPVGTDFQQRVWDAVSAVPWGSTVTYGELASDVGDAGAARAVGTALGKNPLCIIVPCHRVLAAGGGGGYSGGLWRKEWLLKHEKK